MGSSSTESTSNANITIDHTLPDSHLQQSTMRAVICTRYGSPAHLQLQQVERPIPTDNEVLVQVSATAVTAADTMMRKGDSIIGRLIFGWKRPKIPTPGTGFSGTIVATGASVQQFAIADRVLGETGVKFSAHAEFVCLPADGLIIKTPQELDDEAAATLCDGALTSYNFLIDLANLQAGEKLLINGASGSLGTAAIQIAKEYGAHVTAVCSGRNAELVRSLGADEVIDYAVQDFTSATSRYDIIYDCVGQSSYRQSKQALRPAGRYICPVFTLHHLLQMAFTRLFNDKKALFSATGLLPVPKLKEQLCQLLTHVESGKLQTVIDRRFLLDEIVQANSFVDTGRKRGNIVVTMNNCAH